MDPRQFLAQSLKMLQDDKSQEGRRTAISRAYYAAFHVAVQMLAKIELDVPVDANGHKEAYYLLSNSDDTDMAIAGESLDDLRGQRNIADYRLSDANVEKEQVAATLVNQASQLIASLDKCQREQPRLNKMKTAMKSWQRSAGRK